MNAAVATTHVELGSKRQRTSGMYGGLQSSVRAKTTSRVVAKAALPRIAMSKAPVKRLPFASGIAMAPPGKGKGKGKGTSSVAPAPVPKSTRFHVASAPNPIGRALAKSRMRTRCFPVPKKSLGVRRAPSSKACGMKLAPKATQVRYLKAKASAPVRKFDQGMLTRMPTERQTCTSLLPWLERKLNRSNVNKDTLPEIDDAAQRYCERKGTYDAIFAASWDSRLLRLIPVDDWKNSSLKASLEQQIDKLAETAKVDTKSEDIQKHVAYWTEVCQKKAVNLARDLLRIRLEQLSSESSEALEGMDADETLEHLVGSEAT